MVICDSASLSLGLSHGLGGGVGGSSYESPTLGLGVVDLGMSAWGSDSPPS